MPNYKEISNIAAVAQTIEEDLKNDKFSVGKFYRGDKLPEYDTIIQITSIKGTSEGERFFYRDILDDESTSSFYEDDEFALGLVEVTRERVLIMLNEMLSSQLD